MTTRQFDYWHQRKCWNTGHLIMCSSQFLIHTTTKKSFCPWTPNTKTKAFNIFICCCFSLMFSTITSLRPPEMETLAGQTAGDVHIASRKKNDYKTVRLRGLDSRGIDSDDAVPLQFRLMGKYSFEAFSRGRRTFLPFFKFSEMLRSGHAAD